MTADDDGFIARLRSGENEAEHHAADEIERLRAENDRLRTQLRGITQSDPDAELLAEVERLRSVIKEAVDRLAHHEPDEANGRHCWACGHLYPCAARFMADDLTAALEGTTDDG